MTFHQCIEAWEKAHCIFVAGNVLMIRKLNSKTLVWWHPKVIVRETDSLRNSSDIFKHLPFEKFKWGKCHQTKKQFNQWPVNFRDNIYELSDFKNSLSRTVITIYILLCQTFSTDISWQLLFNLLCQSMKVQEWVNTVHTTDQGQKHYTVYTAVIVNGTVFFVISSLYHV